MSSNPSEFSGDLLINEVFGGLRLTDVQGESRDYSDYKLFTDCYKCNTHTKKITFFDSSISREYLLTDKMCSFNFAFVKFLSDISTILNANKINTEHGHSLNNGFQYYCNTVT